jgi:serine phosphatase RsbU (regulator of sigma subunit)/Tfp pilus assembly protein PilF
MFNRHPVLIYLLFIILGSEIRAQSDIPKSETALVSYYINKAQEFSSVNPDSAHYYGFAAESKAERLKNDTLLAQAWFITAKIYYLTSEFEAAGLYQSKALALAKKVNDRSLMAKAYNLHGAILFNAGNYDEALIQYKNKLQINLSQKDTSAILQGYYNIALVYSTLGRLKEYVEIIHKGLELAEKTKDTINIMVLNEGLGSAYNDMNNPRKGLVFLQKAFDISKQKNMQYEEGGILIDIGNVYQSLNQNDSALYFYQKAIDLSQKTGDKKRRAVALFNVARIKTLLKDYKTALDLSGEAIKISTEINYTKGLCESMINRAEVLYELGDLDRALETATRAKDIATTIKTKKEEAESYRILNKIYDRMGNIPEAYFAFKRSIELRDSLENNNQLRTLSGMELDYEKEKIEQERRYKEEADATELKKQKQIRNLIVITCCALLILLFFILRNYIAKLKANKEIIRQKKIIEEKNRAILQSINYSKQIQDAMLPVPAQITKLLPESFILFKPKDIVSGDFYFIEPVSISSSDNWAAVVLADCTGHGVPGALMSITGYNMLRQSINEPSVKSPGEALDFLNRELHSLLRQDQKEVHIRDGMDIAFCAVNLEENILVYAGANNPLWVLSSQQIHKDPHLNTIHTISEQNGKYLYEIKANKQHIGFNESQRPFNTTSLRLSRGDLIYLFTDGYADQFGGPSGKKYKYKKLADSLFEIHNLSMDEQKQRLEASFENWKGDLEQVDDVSIIGFKI